MLKDEVTDLTVSEYDDCLKAITVCESKDVIEKAYYNESKNDHGIVILYAYLFPRISIAFKGEGRCCKGYGSNINDSICIRITTVSPIIREQVRKLHESLVTKYPQYKNFSYKNPFSSGALVIYDKINNRFEPFKGKIEVSGKLHPFNCTLSLSIKLNYKVLGELVLGERIRESTEEFTCDYDYDLYGKLLD